MTAPKEKGLWKRTILLFTNIRIPIPLYLLQVLFGIASTRVALMYVPLEAQLKLGNIEENTTIFTYLGLMLLVALASILAQIPSFYSTAIVTRRLQDKLIDRSLRLPMRSYESRASMIVSWITQDCTLANGLLSSIAGFVTGIASTVMTVSTMSALDKGIGYVIVIIVIYVIFSTWLEGRLLFLRQRRDRLAQSELTAFFAEHLSFFTEIRQLHAASEELERGRRAIKRFYDADIYMAVLTLINNFVSGSIPNVITILVFVLGIRSVNAGTMTLTELAAFQNYMLIAYQSFSSLPQIYSTLMYYNGQLYYIASLMAEKEDVYDRAVSMPDAPADLRFEDVTFRYGETEVVSHASFTIPAGQTTVIAGPNGSGKSTLLRLIERFYTPDGGQILLGDVPAEQIHLGDWRRSFGYVLQEPQLFDGTVRENIVYGAPEGVSEDDVNRAVRLAGAEDFIRELPDGADYRIGENGARLSGGQRQRLAIARALLTDPSCLLLDEATASMDVSTAKAVSDSLEGCMAGRTTVIISHDMNVLSRADHVIVLSDGRVEAEGTREEALAASPTLRALCGGEEAA